MMFIQTRKARGFTLIELLVVIAIIGILSSIVVASLGDARTKGRDTKRISDIKNIQTALALYYNDNLKYPNSASGNPLNVLVTAGYISVIPQDPGTSYTYQYQAYTTNSNGNCTLVPPTGYHLGAVLENAASVPGDDVDRETIPSGFFVCGTGTFGIDFHGQSPDCSYDSSNLPDNCYDVVNN